ncbi:YezD family protein [Paenibacillus sp. SC116]|uniref:YezD family protein n=1 Tax=Paenibacillus sp. SC116 TaxID=2968986 RepID=UPI002810EE48|nr:YezD family protein [Paenibacillus sp. SC116]
MSISPQRENDSTTGWSTESIPQADVWLTRIAEHLNDLRYGSLNIVVHDGRIVQIDRLERHRYDLSDSLSSVKEKGVLSHDRRTKKKN